MHDSDQLLCRIPISCYVRPRHIFLCFSVPWVLFWSMWSYPHMLINSLRNILFSICWNFHVEIIDIILADFTIHQYVRLPRANTHLYEFCLMVRHASVRENSSCGFWHKASGGLIMVFRTVSICGRYFHLKQHLKAWGIMRTLAKKMCVLYNVLLC